MPKLNKTTFSTKKNPTNPNGSDVSRTQTKVTDRKNLFGQNVTKVRKTVESNYNNPKTAKVTKSGYKKVNGVIKNKY